jgi:tRNA dimethylallyltransferase
MDSRLYNLILEAKETALIIVLGPTASGKTRFAIKLAQIFNGEIISADSRQVYKRMNIGTGKDLYEYKNAAIKYHLIDTLEAGQKYNLQQFQLDYNIALEKIKNHSKKPILCGGSGLYLEAAIAPKLNTQIPENHIFRETLQSKTLAELNLIWVNLKQDKRQNYPDLSTHKRAIRAIEIAQFLIDNPAFNFATRTIDKYLVFGIEPTLNQRRKNIEVRLQSRLKNGMIEEVESLVKGGLSKEELIYYGLEYKYLALYLYGHLTYEQMCQQLLIAIQQFAKRQMTYFRKMEKDGIKINWFKPEEINEIYDYQG